MKRRSRQLRTPLLVLVGLFFAATTLLQCPHFASASTTTGTATPSSSSSSGRTGVLGKTEETNDPNEVVDGENDGDIDIDIDIDIDDEATAAEEATKKTQKFSWQFFYRKDETTETEENEEDGNNDSNENDYGGKSRFRFGIRRRRNRDEVDDSNKLEGMFTTSDADDQDQSEKSNESEAKDTEEDNSEATKHKNDNDHDHDDSSQEKDESSLPSSESTDGKDKKADGDAETKKDGEASDETKDAGKDDTPEKKNNESPQDPMQQYIEQYQNAQRMQQQRLMGYPGAIIYRSPPSRQPYPMRPGIPPQDGQGSGLSGIAPGQAMAAAALVNLLSLASRIFFLKWLIDRLAFESESKSPIQHFMWECLNDKFVKDDEIWKRVLSRVPQSMGVSQRRWGRTVKAMGPQKKKEKDPAKKQKRGNKRKNGKSQQQQRQQQGLVIDPTKNDQVQTQQPLKETSKTVVVMDFSTVNAPNPDFLRFADVVTFLVGSNGPRKQMFGPKPEVVLMLQSPGGEVTSFAFAAAQVARLRNAGWNVTVCVDRIAASGGYMIASQATQILASPFAMVGSVGVITETLNFYEILKQHGIKSLVLKAGDSKNPLTQFGEVTDEDIKTTQKDLDETHQSFIDLCRSRRPGLDAAVCNGRILSGDKALERGMIDRILTSDEYILEKIAEGDLVMKLHLVSGNSERHMIANALQILPHLSSKFKRFMFAGGGDDNNVVKRALGKLSSWVDGRVRMDGNFASRVVQLVGLASMVRRAMGRSGSFVPEEAMNDYNYY